MGGQQADGWVLKDDCEGDLQAQVLLDLRCSAYSIRFVERVAEVSHYYTDICVDGKGTWTANSAARRESRPSSSRG